MWQIKFYRGTTLVWCYFLENPIWVKIGAALLGLYNLYTLIKLYRSEK